MQQRLHPTKTTHVASHSLIRGLSQTIPTREATHKLSNYTKHRHNNVVQQLLTLATSRATLQYAYKWRYMTIHSCWRSLPRTSGHLSNTLVILLSNLGLSNCFRACINLNPLRHLRLVRGMYPHLGHLQHGLLSSIMALVHHTIGNFSCCTCSDFTRINSQSLGKKRKWGYCKHLYHIFVFFMQGEIRQWQVHSCSNIHVPWGHVTTCVGWHCWAQLLMLG